MHSFVFTNMFWHGLMQQEYQPPNSLGTFCSVDEDSDNFLGKNLHTSSAYPGLPTCDMQMKRYEENQNENNKS